MRSLTILADDLTGALDTAAPFATPSEPVRVSWRDDALSGSTRIALDTESRDAPAADATARVVAALERFGDAGLCFKKIDSLIRGNALAETAACAARTAFRSVVIAPAFPEQDRITRCGTQIAPGRDKSPTAVADVAGSLRNLGVVLTPVRRGGLLPERGVSVCDAETPGDLAAIARQGVHLEGPVLWCGSAGLARALGRRHGGGATTLAPGPRLFIVGSRHPVAMAQAARLARILHNGTAAITGGSCPTSAIAPAARAVAAGRSAAIVFALPPVDADRARDIMIATFAAVARLAPPAVVVVIGGDTAFRLCQSLAATSLLALGECAAGVAMARIVDGTWNGTGIVTKSGAFADSNALTKLLDAPLEEECT